MCYYNGQRVTKIEYIRLMQLEKQLRKIMTNRVQIGFDYSDCQVIKPAMGGKDFDIVDMEWGFIPSYLRTRADVIKMRTGGIDPASGKFKPPIITLNAIGEELLLPNKIYRQAALSRRCLVLSWGFYEWRHIYPIGKKGQVLKTAAKYPYHIALKDQEYFFIAGIWQPWTDKETGETVDSVAVVTTKANALMEQVHNSKKRMPTILPETLAAEWIQDGLSEQRITELATYQLPAEKMEAYPIRKDFIQADDPTEAFNYEDLPALVV